MAKPRIRLNPHHRALATADQFITALRQQGLRISDIDFSQPDKPVFRLTCLPGVSA